MELNWSTFALEILNFLVLVWILKRFLYRPVLGVIAQRRAGIAKTLTDAQALKTEAEALRSRYEGRLVEWEQERQRAQAALSEELEQERAHRLAQLREELEQEHAKARAAQGRREAELRRSAEAQALSQAARFVARLFQAATGPDLEARLVDLAIEELTRLPEARRTELRRQWGETPGEIQVSTAYPLAPERRQRLETTLKAVGGRAMPMRLEQDPALLAGLRIEIGPWVLEANLAGELAAFAEWEHGR